MASYNDRYWKNREERAAKAAQETQEREQKYRTEIANSIKYTRIYDGTKSSFPFVNNPGKAEQILVNCTSEQAVMNYARGVAAVLNFASYKNPGGAYLKGSSAQEEALCHASYLYNVLRTFDDTYYAENRKSLNKALYRDRALYTWGVLFFDGDRSVSCDVLTCAAPNWTTASKYNAVTKEENRRVLEQRIRFVIQVAEASHVETLIAGAYGAGVFGQDAEEVARLFKKLTKNTSIKRIIYAVPAIKDSKNLDAFIKVFGEPK